MSLLINFIILPLLKVEFEAIADKTEQYRKEGKKLFTTSSFQSHNLVDRNLQILDVVDVLKEIYPALEFLFFNQHLQLSEIQVAAQSALHQHIPFNLNRYLKEELLQFREEFAFPGTSF